MLLHWAGEASPYVASSPLYSTVPRGICNSAKTTDCKGTCGGDHAEDSDRTEVGKVYASQAASDVGAAHENEIPKMSLAIGGKQGKYLPTATFACVPRHFRR